MLQLWSAGFIKGLLDKVLHVRLDTPDGFPTATWQGLRRPHYTELFSCGMEAITHGRFSGLKGRPTILLPAPGGLSAADRAQPPNTDTEHLALVLELLSSANKRIP